MKKNITLIATALVLSVCFALPHASLAQDGSLDLSFGNDGIVTTSIVSSDAIGYAVAIQSDGKMVVAGSSSNGSDNDFALIRYNNDGSLDTDFDTDGIVTTAIGTNGGWAKSVAIQSDGKIVVAGSANNSVFYTDFALVRYNTNGSLDTTFGTDGIVITDIGTFNDEANSVAIQSDGRIVAAGLSWNGGNSYFALIRYNTNGTLDTTFDTDGIVTTDFGSTINWGYAVAIQNDGKIVVAGIRGNILNSHFALIRYNTDGTLDNSFDTDGKVTTSVGIHYDGGYSIAIQSDDKIVVAGYSSSPNGSDDDFALVRYNNDGSLDTTFDTDGIVITPFGPFADTGLSVAIQSDGKIVVAGYSIDNGASYVFALVRYNTNGSLDTTFDTDGKVTTLFGTFSDTGYAGAIQSDGKIVMVGDSWNGTSSDFAVVRYNNSIPVGINETDDQTTEISIYPNPFSSITTINSGTIFNDATLTIYNLYGQQVKQLTGLSGHTISFHRDNLPNGLYFIQLTKDNKITSTNKLIITE